MLAPWRVEGQHLHHPDVVKPQPQAQVKAAAAAGTAPSCESLLPLKASRDTQHATALAIAEVIKEQARTTIRTLLLFSPDVHVFNQCPNVDCLLQTASQTCLTCLTGSCQGASGVFLHTVTNAG